MEWHPAQASMAAVVALGAVAPAQEQREDDEREPPRQQGLQPSGEEPRFLLHRAEDLIGAEVQDRTDDDVGEVQDLLIEGFSGDVRYALVSVGEELTAVPWSALKARHGGDADEHELGGLELVGVTEEELESAPAFDDERLPNLDQAWERRIHGHYGMQVPMSEDQDGAPVSIPVFVRASELKGADVRSRGAAPDAQAGEEGEDLGHVSMLAIDPREARVTYALLETEENEQIADRQVAIPWGMFRVTFVDGELGVTAPGLTRSKLARAPVGERDDWTTMSNPNWVREVYVFWDLDPYWSHSVEAGYPEPDTKKNQGIGGGGGQEPGGGDR